VFTPYLAVRGDLYRYTNYVDPNTLVPVPEDSIARAMGTAALTYSYPFVAHSHVGAHIVEPTAQIIYRPARVTQRVLPDEDARSLIFDDTLLFDYDKFSGWDRIETGTRANVGFQYTFQSKSGGYARFVAGQSFHLAGENPYTTPGSILVKGVAQPVFTANSGLGTDRSDYVLGAYLAPVDIFRFVGQVRLDETDLSLNRADLYAVLRLGPVTAVANYSLAAGDPAVGLFGTQQDFYGIVTLDITKNWSISAYARYDIDANFLLQDAIRVTYRDECFVLTASYTETFISNPALDQRPDRTLMLTFELKHIGQFKYKSDTLDHVFGENQTPKF